VASVPWNRSSGYGNFFILQRDEVLESADFERAAEHFKACRTRGIQSSNRIS
jgi:hypothetical protein